MKCTACGFPIEPEDRFCGECGEKVVSKENETIYTSSVKDEQPEPIVETKKVVEPIVEEVAIDSTVTPEPTNVQSEPKVEVQPKGESQPNVEQSQETRREYPKIEIDAERMAKQSQVVARQSYSFVSSALKEHDSILESDKKFSMGLILGLIGAGILLIFLGTFINLPTEIEQLGVNRSEISFKFAFGILILLAISIGVTYGAIAMTVATKVDFHKFLSDYVLLNTVSIALIISGFLLTWIDLRIAPTYFYILGITSIFISSVYLIARYAVHRPSRIASFYGVLVYIIALIISYYLVFDSMLKDAIGAIDGILQSFTQFL